MPKLETVKVGSSSSSESSGNSDDDEEVKLKEDTPQEDSAIAKGTSLQYEIADGLEIIEGEGESNNVAAAGDGD